jgi:hypothetical protein
MLASIALKGWPQGTGGSVDPPTLVFLRKALAALAVVYSRLPWRKRA